MTKKIGYVQCIESAKQGDKWFLKGKVYTAINDGGYYIVDGYHIEVSNPGVFFDFYCSEEPYKMHERIIYYAKCVKDMDHCGTRYLEGKTYRIEAVNIGDLVLSVKMLDGFSINGAVDYTSHFEYYHDENCEYLVTTNSYSYINSLLDDQFFAAKSFEETNKIDMQHTPTAEECISVVPLIPNKMKANPIKFGY